VLSQECWAEFTDQSSEDYSYAQVWHNNWCQGFSSSVYNVSHQWRKLVIFQLKDFLLIYRKEYSMQGTLLFFFFSHVKKLRIWEIKGSQQWLTCRKVCTSVCFKLWLQPLLTIQTHNYIMPVFFLFFSRFCFHCP